MAYATYVREVILGGLLLDPESDDQVGDAIEMHTTTGAMGARVDPYVHTMHTFKSVSGGTARQQKCVLCLKSGRKTKTAFYCGLCATTASREELRQPTKHAYCMGSQHQCFARHIAACFQFQQQHDQDVPSRDQAEPHMPAGTTVAGPTYVTSHPKRQRRGKKRQPYTE